MDARKRNLQAEDWLEAGIRILIADGHEALKLKRLVDEAGVTTGSFYWHFADIRVYRAELIRYWVECFLPSLVEKVRSSAPAGKQLGTLTREIRRQKGYVLDAVMRDWARTDAQAKQSLKVADEIRRQAVLDASQADGIEFSRDELKLLGLAWQGSVDMQDVDERFRLLAMVRRDEQGNASN